MIPLNQGDNSANDAATMIYGLDDFLRRHTGDVKHAGDLFVINSENIVCNNLHYEVALSGYMPNGTAVTEAQALIVLGYIYAYRATKDSYFLDRAKTFMDAYIKVYYQGQPIPESPSLWRCHWAVNGKEPFQALGPVNYQKMSATGALAVDVVFSNGVGWVPAGAPYQGALARVYQVFSGDLVWNNVFAGVDPPGRKYNMSYFVDSRGLRMRGDGSYVDDVSFNIDGSVTTGSQQYVQLANARKIVLGGTDATFTGTLKINFATRTGPVIDRNKPFEGWPMWSSVSQAEYGNAVDAEEWFCEAAYLLYEDTNDVRYLKAFNSCYYTLQQIAQLGGEDYYFIRTTSAKTPFTEGVSYSWESTTNASALVTREDKTGYILVEKEEELFTEDVSTVALEQIAIFNQVNGQSFFSLDISASEEVHVEFIMTLQASLSSSSKTNYRFAFKANGSFDAVVPQSVPLNRSLAMSDGGGVEYVVYNSQKQITTYGSATAQTVFTPAFLDDRSDYVNRLSVNDGSSGVVLGFWGTNLSTRPLGALTYRTVDGPARIKVRDANNWTCHYDLPSSSTWTTLSLSWSNFVISPGQVGAPSTPTSTTALTQFQIVATNEECVIEVYAFGTLPPFYSGAAMYLTKLSIQYFAHEGFSSRIGDVRIVNQSPLQLKYTPGAFTFTTNYSREKGKQDYWRGVLNIGYQHGPVWALQGNQAYWLNIVDAMYDSQEYFRTYMATKGRTIVGPFTPIYLWPRYDNMDYGPVDSWVFYEWGDTTDEVWGGYNSRAFYSACRLVHALWERGYAVPSKLVTVVQRYCTYLADFMDTHDDLTPTVFPNPDLATAADKANNLDIPYNDGWTSNPSTNRPDHTGHMTGSYMAGAILLHLAGYSSTIPQLDRIIEGCMREFTRTYVVEPAGDPSNHMSGGFSSWVGGNYFYGFWAGEIFRALALYIVYKDKQKLGATNDTVIVDQVGLENGDALLDEAGNLFDYDIPIIASTQAVGLEDDESYLLMDNSTTDLITYE